MSIEPLNEDVGLLSGTLIGEAWEGITAEVNSHFLDWNSSGRACG